MTDSGTREVASVVVGCRVKLMLSANAPLDSTLMKRLASNLVLVEAQQSNLYFSYSKTDAILRE